MSSAIAGDLLPSEYFHALTVKRQPRTRKVLKMVSDVNEYHGPSCLPLWKRIMNAQSCDLSLALPRGSCVYWAGVELST